MSTIERKSGFAAVWVLAIVVGFTIGVAAWTLAPAQPVGIGGRPTGLYAVESSSLTCTSQVSGPTLDAEDGPACVLLVDLTAFTGTNVTPRYQGSWDGTTFYTIASGAAMTATGQQTNQSTGWPRYVRVRLDPTAASACTATVRYACKR